MKKKACDGKKPFAWPFAMDGLTAPSKAWAMGNDVNTFVLENPKVFGVKSTNNTSKNYERKV